MNRRKTVLVTGASRGIGRITAERFGMEGYNVLVHYYRSDDKAQELVENLKSKGCRAALFQADVSNRTQVDAMMDYCIQTFGDIDIVINNAGISCEKLFTDLSEAEWDEMMNVNLKSVFHCSQSVLRYMLPKKQGKIINISSIWGMVGASCEVHYSAAKAGVIGFTKALAKELGPSNIQVNCIAPGVISTDMLAQHSEEDLEALKEATPLGKIGRPEDIAACALYLAAESGDFMTGQVISPNGGFVI